MAVAQRKPSAAPLKIVGAVAGWLAGMVVKGGGYGLLGNIVDRLRMRMACRRRQFAIRGSVLSAYPQALLCLAKQSILYYFLCFDLFAGRADEHELLQTRSKFSDRPEVLHGVATRGAY